jgi:hypothetical protein
MEQCRTGLTSARNSTQSRYAVDSPDGEGEGFVHAYAIGADGTLTPVGDKQAIGGAVP